MPAKQPPDAIDAIVQDLQAQLPDADLGGLPILARVMRLARHLEARREAQLADLGLSVADFDVLATLRRRAETDPINARDLQQLTMLSSGGTTKRLDRLERAGLIERHPDPADRRGVRIRLTKAGRKLVESALRAVLKAEAELVRDAIASSSRRGQIEEGLRLLLANREAQK